LTPDIQFIKGAQKQTFIGGVETIKSSTVLGLRLKRAF